MPGGDDLDRVGEQVVEHLVEPPGGGPDLELPLDPLVELDAALARERGPGVDATGDDGCDLDRLGPGRRPLGSRELQQPVDQAREPGDLVERAGHLVLRRTLGPGQVTLQVLEPQPQRGERRAQLVGRVRDERLLRRRRAPRGAPRCG